MNFEALSVRSEIFLEYQEGIGDLTIFCINGEVKVFDYYDYDDELNILF